MKPALLLTRTIYAPALAALERELILHRLWTEPQPAAYVREACGSVRAAATTTTVGFSRRVILSRRKNWDRHVRPDFYSPSLAPAPAVLSAGCS